jgi:flagellar biosynthesis protein FliR
MAVADRRLYGFGMVNVLDPLSQVQTSVIGQLKLLIGLWFILHWNGLILLFQGCWKVSVYFFGPG